MDSMSVKTRPIIETTVRLCFISWPKAFDASSLRRSSLARGRHSFHVMTNITHNRNKSMFGLRRESGALSYGASSKVHHCIPKGLSPSRCNITSLQLYSFNRKLCDLMICMLINALCIWLFTWKRKFMHEGFKVSRDIIIGRSNVKRVVMNIEWNKFW